MGAVTRGRPLAGRLLILLIAAVAGLLAVLHAAPATAAPAPTPVSARPVSAAPAAEQALLSRYLPYFRFSDDGECGPASYRPVDVTPLFDNRQIVLRGPWD